MPPIDPSPSLWKRIFGPGKRTKDIHLPEDFEEGYYHPVGVPETGAEKLLKSGAKNYGTLIQEDYPYFEQYIHPDYDVLPKQELRPTINGRIPNADDPYRHVARGVWDHPDHPDYNLMGLGNHFESTQNPDYDSVYDRWDFDTKTPLTTDDYAAPSTFPFLAKEYLAKKLLTRVGKPYNVYERMKKGTLEDKKAEYTSLSPTIKVKKKMKLIGGSNK